ncbi:MAG: hypothetical protein GX620_13570 [Chloroflexi bacterium]|nr:hypothetical protein [Chloroflexota bacterium]
MDQSFSPTQANKPDVPPPPPRGRLRAIQVLTIITIIAAFAGVYYFKDRLDELRQYGYAAVFLSA